MAAQFTPTPEAPSDDDKLWVLLTYILTPLVPIIVLFMEDKKNRPFIKAHNAQALALGVVEVVVSGVLTPVLGLGCILSVVCLILNIFYGIKGNKGEYINIPVLTDFVKKQNWA
jgi:uncharacterized protein